MERQGVAGRGRAPFSVVNTASAVSEGDGVECSTVEFTKEDVDALLNEKMKKGNPYDNKVSFLLVYLIKYYLFFFLFIFGYCWSYVMWVLLCAQFLFCRKKWSRWGILLRGLNFAFDGLKELKKAMFKRKKSFSLNLSLLLRRALILVIIRSILIFSVVMFEI